MPSIDSVAMKRRLREPRWIGLSYSLVAWLLLLIHSVVITQSAAVSARYPTVDARASSSSSSSSSSKTQRPSTVSNSSTSFSWTAATTLRPSSPWLHGIKNSVASSLAAATSKIILAPFDTIKTLQQHARTSNHQASISLIEAARIITSRPRGFWELYAGLGISVVGSMPSVALYFGVYSYCKNQFQQLAVSSPWIRDPDATWVRVCTIAVSAALGNTLASASRVPYEVLKQKLQTNAFRSTGQAIWHLSQTGGLRAFFPPGAIAIQTMRDVPYAVVTLLSYELLKRQPLPFQSFYNNNNNRTVTSSQRIQHRRHRLEYRDLIWGGIAGGLGSWVTNPLDVMKTRIQTSPEDYRGGIGNHDNNILWECFRETWQEGGAWAFFRGSVPRLLHKVPANALFFVFYEFFRRVLHVHDDDNQSEVLK